MLTTEEQNWAYEAVTLVRLINDRLESGAEFKNATRWDVAGFWASQKDRVQRYRTNVRMTRNQMVQLRNLHKNGLRGGTMRKRDRVKLSDYCAEGDHTDCYDRDCECSCHRGAAA